jgi:twitching motility protein PilI
MTETTPFEVLYQLAQRSQLTDVELPARENTRTHWNGLGFSLLSQTFVVSMREVGELLRVPHTTNIPGVKHFVVGVANVRGRLLIVIDLAAFFGAPSRYARTQRRILAVEDEDQYFGFMVDESLGMQHFPSEAFSETVTGVDPRFTPFLNGCYSVSGVEWPVISLSRLAQHPALEKLHASAA